MIFPAKLSDLYRVIVHDLVRTWNATFRLWKLAKFITWQKGKYSHNSRQETKSNYSF